jgi:hypothetical protein
MGDLLLDDQFLLGFDHDRHVVADGAFRGPMTLPHLLWLHDPRSRRVGLADVVTS